MTHEGTRGGSILARLAGLRRLYGVGRHAALLMLLAMPTLAETRIWQHRLTRAFLTQWSIPAPPGTHDYLQVWIEGSTATAARITIKTASGTETKLIDISRETSSVAVFHVQPGELVESVAVTELVAARTIEAK